MPERCIQAARLVPKSEPAMTYRRFRDAIDGLKAYDHGCVSSGIRDELLRAEVKAHLHTEEGGRWLTQAAYDLIMSPKARKQGYGLEDMRRMLDWLRDEMGCDV
jgi:RimJ/RimL family protein N-acetyltransferase